MLVVGLLRFFEGPMPSAGWLSAIVINNAVGFCGCHYAVLYNAFLPLHWLSRIAVNACCVLPFATGGGCGTVCA